jgi:hypothetical protein
MGFVGVCCNAIEVFKCNREEYAELNIEPGIPCCSPPAEMLDASSASNASSLSSMVLRQSPVHPMTLF